MLCVWYYTANRTITTTISNLLAKLLLPIYKIYYKS